MQNPTGWPAFAGHDSGVVVRNGASNAGKQPLFGDGWVLGAIQELGDLYAPGVRVSS